MAMVGFFLIVVLLVATISVWLKRGGGRRRSLMFETSGLSYFKLLLRQRGVDVKSIPDGALTDILRVKISAAKSEARVASMTDATNRRKNWRINLVRALEAEANIVATLMTKGLEGHQGTDAATVLTKHGVLKSKEKTDLSGMTAEQFLEATRRGTLYSELGKRQAKRETS